MTTTATPATSTPSASSGAKAQFLRVYEQEHATTMRVLRAFPAERAELRPHAKCKTARELAWIFVVERGLGQLVVVDDVFAKGGPTGEMPKAPERWEDILAAVERAHRDFGDRVAAMSDAELERTVRFFVAPKQMGDVRAMDFLWFLLHDEIHHRGQFSIYLRLADAKVPSIYGPSADEPWM